MLAPAACFVANDFSFSFDWQTIGALKPAGDEVADPGTVTLRPHKEICAHPRGK